MEKQKYIIGIDEVGRGPIAGPVAVGAFVFLSNKARRIFRGVKESKQLTEAKREEWFGKILRAQKLGLVDFKVSFQSEKVIDSKGLSFAIRTALGNSLNGLKIQPCDTSILLDGGLKAPANYISQKTIIKGDEKKIVIALASICAKVLRDRRMFLLSKKFPDYGFATHKGYGTRSHYEAVKLNGMLACHRRTFLRKI